MFISFEGPDGSGKSSQIPALAEFLREEGHKVLLTREPGGTEIGDQVRQVLFDMRNKAMHPRSETLLFLASRAQIVEEVIRPALAEGKVVFSDRYADSTLAYQGYGHRADLEELRSIIHYATGGLTPDLTLLLDVDPEVGLSRRDSGGDWNRLDDYDLEFHQRVRDGYHKLAQTEPERWMIINAAQTQEEVFADLQKAILLRFSKEAS
jgi:dTMP kinase